MTNQLRPLEEPYPNKIEKLLSKYPRIDGYLLTLFRTFANSVRFLEKGMPNLLDKESPLPLRIREIVILRTTANKNCEYEWGVHVAVFKKAAQLSEEQISATRAKEVDVSQWSEQEACLLSAVDQLCHAGFIQDDILQQFEKHWTCEQQLEIMSLCGAYHIVSFVANTARLKNEAFSATFPA